MTPATVNDGLAIYQGEPYALVLGPAEDDNGDPLDLTGYDFSAQIRAAFDRTSLELAVFTWDLSDAASGTVVGHLDEETTTALPASGACDIEVTPPGGAKQTWLRATVRSPRDVTT